MASTVTEPAVLAGRSAFGRKAELRIYPEERPGIWWKLPGQDTRVLLGDMRLGVCKALRYLVLTFGDNVIRVPEHLLGYFFAHGLTHVCVELPQCNIPYDGHAWSFASYIKLSDFAESNSHFQPRSPIRVGRAGRSLEWIPDPSLSELEFDIRVDFPGVGRHRLRLSAAETSSKDVMHSRPWVGGERWRQWLATYCKKQHHWVWFDKGDTEPTTQAKLREICCHRLLDLMGALEYLRPPWSRLGGRIVSACAGHALDLVLLRKVQEVGLLQI